MPYESNAQRGFFNANREKMEERGVDVDEWNKASKGLSLPEHAGDAKNWNGGKLSHGAMLGRKRRGIS